jgi:hypothetical protein
MAKYTIMSTLQYNIGCRYYSDRILRRGKTDPLNRDNGFSSMTSCIGKNKSYYLSKNSDSLVTF